MKTPIKNIDFKSIRKKAYESNTTKKVAIETADKYIEDRKRQLLSEYESHPVTVEIESGPNASNGSGTLNGYGNLFSFIGFSSSSNPTSPVKDLISRIRLIKTGVKSSDNGYNLIVKYPTIADFASVTKMPWEAGRSWLVDMEKRISGTGAYLYGKFTKSRSGSAIQTSKDYSNVEFRPVKYFVTIYNKFIKTL